MSKNLQIKTQGRIKINSQESEVTVVQFKLSELLQLVKDSGSNEDAQVLVITNIPDEGVSRAPAYVRMIEGRSSLDAG